MLFAIFLVFVATFCEISSLKCNKCDVDPIASWIIDVNTFPSFPSECKSIEANQQCTASILWRSLPNGKDTLIEYAGDTDAEDIPKDSSLSYAFVDIERDPRSASNRILLYSCTTDHCNDRVHLLRAFSALTIEENFTQLDHLFGNDDTNFTDQSSCLNASNSTRLSCPPSANPLSLCPSCLLLAMESPRELCACCPNQSSGEDNFINRQVFFFLENRTRLADKITLQCQTKGCNALENVQEIIKLSKLEFDFKKFFASSSSINSFSRFSLLWSFLLLLNYFTK